MLGRAATLNPHLFATVAGERLLRGRSMSSHSLARQNARGNSDCNRVRRHVRDHHRVSADRDVVTDANGSKYLGACSYIDPVAEDGRATLSSPAKTNCYTVAQDAVIA